MVTINSAGVAAASLPRLPPRPTRALRVRRTGIPRLKHRRGSTGGHIQSTRHLIKKQESRPRLDFSFEKDYVLYSFQISVQRLPNFSVSCSFQPAFLSARFSIGCPVLLLAVFRTRDGDPSSALTPDKIK